MGLQVAAKDIDCPLHSRRADVVLFVNGIPLVLIELKASHVNVKHGYVKNVRDYRDAIPQLFWTNGFVVVSNGSEAKVGASFAAWEHFTDWKKVESEAEEGRIALETTLRATCRPDRVLDIVENFTVFQEQIGGLVKKIAKNHQYLGVNNALDALRRIGDDTTETLLARRFATASWKAPRARAVVKYHCQLWFVRDARCARLNRVAFYGGR